MQHTIMGRRSDDALHLKMAGNSTTYTALHRIPATPLNNDHPSSSASLLTSAALGLLPAKGNLSVTLRFLCHVLFSIFCDFEPVLNIANLKYRRLKQQPY